MNFELPNKVLSALIIKKLIKEVVEFSTIKMLDSVASLETCFNNDIIPLKSYKPLWLMVSKDIDIMFSDKIVKGRLKILNNYKDLTEEERKTITKRIRKNILILTAFQDKLNELFDNKPANN